MAIKNDVKIIYNISDADNDPCNIKLEYSLDGGSTWITSTNIENNQNIITGNNRELIWHSNLDINDVKNNVIVRLTPNDGYADGNSGISLPFDINNIPRPTSPTNFHVSYASDVGYQLSWNASNGSIDYYRVYITNGGSYSPYFDTSVTSVINSNGGLPGAYVTAYVVAIGPGGESLPSNEINFNMAHTPIKPINLYATHMESTKFLLHWQGDIKMNEYRIEVKNDSGNVVAGTSSQSTAKFIENLSPGTYYCKVKSMTLSSVGYPQCFSDWSDELTVTLV